MAHTLDTSKLDQIFDALETDDAVRKMNSWEIDFVQNVKARWANGGVRAIDKGSTLEKLEEIYQKV